MTRENTAQKAARLIASGHVRVVRCTDTGIALDVLGDSTDAFAPQPYRVMRYLDGGRIVESCTCDAGRVYRSMAARARLLWEPPIRESSR